MALNYWRGQEGNKFNKQPNDKQDYQQVLSKIITLRPNTSLITFGPLPFTREIVHRDLGDKDQNTHTHT